MQALREKIIQEIRESLTLWLEKDADGYRTYATGHEGAADRILAIPEIAEALREKQHGSHDRHIKLDKGALAKITESLKVEPPSDTLR